MLLLWHERELGAFVVANSFVYSARELIVAPGSGARLRVRRKVGRCHHSREIAPSFASIEGPPSAFQSCSEWQCIDPVTPLAR